MNINKILILAAIATLLTTTGCLLVPEGGGHGHEGHERHEEHSAVIVGPPVVVVHQPEVIIR